MPSHVEVGTVVEALKCVWGAKVWFAMFMSLPYMLLICQATVANMLQYKLHSTRSSEREDNQNDGAKQ